MPEVGRPESRWPGRRLSIRGALIGGIVGLQLVTVTAILASSYFSTEQVLVDHARQLMERFSREAADHAERFLEPARGTADLTQRLASHRVLRTDDFAAMQRYFFEQLRLNPFFSGAYFGATDGSFVFVKRDSDRVDGGFFAKTVSHDERGRHVGISWHDPDFRQLERALDDEDPFDPRTRPWYADALEAGGHVWTEPYIFYTSRNPGISAAHPVYDEKGEQLGAVGVDIEIVDLSRFLTTLDISPNARAFVLNHNGDIIAYPNLDEIRRLSVDGGRSLRFAQIDSFGDPVAEAALRSLGLDTSRLDIDHLEFTTFEHDGESYLATLSPLLGKQLPWTIAVYAPKADFLGPLEENQRRNVYIAGAITLLGCIVGFFLWRGIARPMAALRAHALRIHDGDLDSEVRVDSAYREIADTAASFSYMIKGLRERDRHNRELTHGLQASEDQLRQAQKMEALGQLTGGIAHDFNNILSVVVGNLEALEDSLGDGSDQRELAEKAVRAALRGADLTHRLLAFARKQTLMPQVVDLNALVLGMTELLQRALGETVAIEAKVAEDLWPARLDPAQMEAALLNLATNARHAMAAGGRLTIETANRRLDQDFAARHEGVLAGPFVMVAVTDTGCGMTQEILAQVFEPFFTTRSAGEGSGLGLSMVHGFARQSSGHVTIESEPGAGTTVSLFLPAVLDEDAKCAPIPRRDETPRGNGERILLVEDDPDVRSMAVTTLEGLGYRVLEAADGTAALALLDSDDEVSLLFSDVTLPRGMDGAALAARARERRPGLKVLLTSGYSPGLAVDEPEPASSLPVLPKPYRRQVLAQRLRALLDEAGGLSAAGRTPAGGRAIGFTHLGSSVVSHGT